MARTPVNAVQNVGRAVAETERILTNAQMLALLATPITLVDAPGLQQAIVVESVDIFFDVTTTGYTLGTAVNQIEYASGVNIITPTQAGLFDQATDQHRALKPAIGTPDPVVNSAVRMANETAEYTGGNAANLVKVVTRYRVVPANAL